LGKKVKKKFFVKIFNFDFLLNEAFLNNFFDYENDFSNFPAKSDSNLIKKRDNPILSVKSMEGKQII
jgi:hypothetical protein